jgi:hypothetical protein
MDTHNITSDATVEEIFDVLALRVDVIAEGTDKGAGEDSSYLSALHERSHLPKKRREIALESNNSSGIMFVRQGSHLLGSRKVTVERPLHVHRLSRDETGTDSEQMSVHPNTADDQVNVGIVGQIWDSSAFVSTGRLYFAIAALADSEELFNNATILKCGDAVRKGKCALAAQEVPSYWSLGAPDRPISPTRIGDILANNGRGYF